MYKIRNTWRTNDSSTAKIIENNQLFGRYKKETINNVPFS